MGKKQRILSLARSNAATCNDVAALGFAINTSTESIASGQAWPATPAAFANITVKWNAPTLHCLVLSNERDTARLSHGLDCLRAKARTNSPARALQQRKPGRSPPSTT
jgi:hypothetical protein